jgi:hypothetical protein
MPQEMNKVAFNQKVRPYIASNELDKVAAALEPYVKLRLYEDSFADRILAVRQVTEADLIPEIENDSFYVIGKVEQATEAAVVANFIDRPTERYISGKRYKIPLGKHKTPIARKQKDELMAYDYDILADAADKDVFELGILRDWKLIAAMNECIRFSGKQMDDVVGTSNSGAVQIDKIHINRLESVLNSGGRTGLPAKDELKATRLLFNDMTRRDFALLSQPTLGDELAGRVFTEGFTIDRIQGVQYISSIKHRLLTEHEYASLVTFSGATAAGHAVVVNGVSFDVEAGSAELAAQKLADGINASTDPAIRTTADGHALPVVRAEVEGATVRVITVPVADAEDRLFIGGKVAVDASGSAVASVVAEGFDRYDIVWAFPDEEFIGEIIRISGQDITTEMWKTNGEEMINRVCREWFGLGIGNYNGVAKMRLQRSRVLA